MFETSSVSLNKISLNSEKLLSRITNDIHGVIQQLSQYTVNNDSKYKLNYIPGFFKKFQANLSLQFSRSKLLIQLLPNLENPNEKLITNYCVILEVLHLASELHGLIGSTKKNSQILNISNEHIILFGDLLFTIAFDKLLLINNASIMEHFVTITQQIAESESLLSNLINIEDKPSGYDKVLTATMDKYWPLFQSIIFFYELHGQQNIADISQQIIKHHYDYVLRKIINNKLLVNAELHNFIYSKNCLAYLAKKGKGQHCTTSQT